MSIADPVLPGDPFRLALLLLSSLAIALMGTACDTERQDEGGDPEPSVERAIGGLIAERDDRPALTVSADHPNVVLVVTDDQSLDQMRAMPAARRILGRQGTTFTDAFASYPLCCPSRVTMLTGQFAHNHGAQGNRPFKDGGGYVNLRRPRRVLPAWLQASGYTTVHLGKWANSPGSKLPAGWDWWGYTRNSTTGYYNYDLRTPDGDVVRFGEEASDYHTDALTQVAEDFMEAHGSETDRPFFLSLAYLAPHDGEGRDDEAGERCGGVKDGVPAKGTAQPAPGDARAFAGATAPRPPSFNEPDVSNKPPYVRQLEPLSDERIDKIDRDYGCELASLRAVDRSIASLWRTLRRTGLARHTAFIFTSDQGNFHGQHRRGGGKNLPYEEVIRVPLLVRGPGVVKGQRSPALASNIDLAPTILELTGVNPPEHLWRRQDGRSLGPLLNGKARWPRRALLIEGRQQAEEADDGSYVALSYQAVRTRRYTYTEHFEKRTVNARQGGRARIGDGERIFVELYDLRSDPFQRENLAGSNPTAPTQARLARLLRQLATCSGERCRRAETSR
jgi:N-acetylglucosamine-6-sulfatase